MKSFKEYIIESKMTYPLISFKALYHVGTLNIAKRQDGFEGNNLSVSTVPDSWRKINKGATGGDVWELTKKNNKFLDYHNLTKAQWNQINKWGIKNDYLIPAIVYRVWTTNEEGEERYSDYYTKEKAKDEAYDESNIEIIKKSLKATPKMQQRIGNTDVSLITVLFAEEILNIDGVYWTDVHDISSLSAPRGTILNTKLNTWNKKNLGNIDIGDDEQT
jgi:hypothetical protein